MEGFLLVALWLNESALRDDGWWAAVGGLLLVTLRLRDGLLGVAGCRTRVGGLLSGAVAALVRLGFLLDWRCFDAIAGLLLLLPVETVGAWANVEQFTVALDVGLSAEGEWMVLFAFGRGSQAWVGHGVASAGQTVRLACVANADEVLREVVGLQRMAFVALSARVSSARRDGRFASVTGPGSAASALVRRWAGLVALAFVHAWLIAFADALGVLDLFALVSGSVVDEVSWAVHDFVVLLGQAGDVLAGVLRVSNVGLWCFAGAERC